MERKKWLSALALSTFGLGSFLTGTALAQVFEEEGGIYQQEKREVFETEGQPQIFEEGAFEEEGLLRMGETLEQELSADEFGSYPEELDWSTQDRGFEAWYGNVDEFWF